MAIHVDVDKLKEVLKRTMVDHLEDMKDDLAEDWQGRVDEVLGDIARISANATSEDDVAMRNLQHLRAQAQLIGASIAIREQERVVATLTNVLTVSLQVVGRALVAAVIAA